MIMKTELYNKWAKSVDEHRIAVVRAGVLLGVTPFRLSNHDISKYSEMEAEGYALRFIEGVKSVEATLLFEKAFRHHVHNNDHHWQHWVLGDWKMEMPEDAALEMIADWMGASATHGKGGFDCRPWFHSSFKASHHLLHERTFSFVVDVLNSKKYLRVLELLEQETSEGVGWSASSPAGTGHDRD